MITEAFQRLHREEMDRPDVEVSELRAPEEMSVARRARLRDLIVLGIHVEGLYDDEAMSDSRSAAASTASRIRAAARA